VAHLKEHILLAKAEGPFCNQMFLRNGTPQNISNLSNIFVPFFWEAGPVRGTNLAISNMPTVQSKLDCSTTSFLAPALAKLQSAALKIECDS
jgi:hypothetical protein